MNTQKLCFLDFFFIKISDFQIPPVLALGPFINYVTLALRPERNKSKSSVTDRRREV